MVKLHLSGDVVISQCLCLSRDHFHFRFLSVSCTSTPYCLSIGIKNRLLKNDLKENVQLGEGSCIRLKIGKNKTHEHISF